MPKKFIDIAANFGDPVFKGIYRGNQKHRNDMVDILKRAQNVGMIGMLITSGNYAESVENIKFIQQQPEEITSFGMNFYTTVGVHPTRCSEFFDTQKAETPEQYIQNLTNLIQENRSIVGAIGECGCDNDRLHFSPIEHQMAGFRLQLNLAEKFDLPLFLHSRNSTKEFLEVLLEEQKKRPNYKFRGCVHSFTDSTDDLKTFLNETDFYIGINGCSLKTEDNLATIKNIPLDRLLLETDCPWCGIKNTHASKKFVKTEFPSSKKFKEDHLMKDRNEPCQILNVAEVVAGVLDCDIDELVEACYKNTLKCFDIFQE